MIKSLVKLGATSVAVGFVYGVTYIAVISGMNEGIKFFNDPKGYVGKLVTATTNGVKAAKDAFNEVYHNKEQEG